MAHGIKRREEIDFSETFVSTVSGSRVCLWSAIACECDIGLRYFDVNQAFVQANLGDIFLRLSEGCDDLSGKIVRSNNNLYGLRLKQASRKWHA